MLITADNYKEVIRYRKLHNQSLYDAEDRVLFQVNDDKYEYRCEPSYLSSRSGLNDIIFDVLGLDKVEFCTKVYGHKPRGGVFPVCVVNQTEGMYNIVEALMEECIRVSHPVKKVNLQDLSLPLLSGLELPEEKSQSIKRRAKLAVNWLEEDIIANPFI